MATYYGTQASDVYTGPNENNFISGAPQANPNIDLGSDSLTGGTLQDTIFGWSGNDTLRGNGGNDSLNGGDGNDDLFGGDGNDIIFSGNGTDDQLRGELGNDVLFITGGQAFGGDGADTLIGSGTSSLYGGNGDDRYLLNSSSAKVFEFANGGFDVILIDYADASFNDITIERIELADAGSLTLGSAYLGTVFGSTGDDTISLGSNTGFVVADEGDDLVIGDTGDDEIFGSEGDDTVQGGSGDDTLEGQEGSDVLEGGAGNDLLTDGDFEDFASQADVLLGGAGNDRLVSLAGADTLDGGSGIDIFEFKRFDSEGNGPSFSFTLPPNGGPTTLLGVELVGIERIDFELGDGDVTVVGGNRSDTIQAFDGTNVLSGRGGNDFLRTGFGDDLLLGGAGLDMIVGGNGEDTLIGGSGRDTLAGDGQADAFRYLALDGKRDIIVDFELGTDRLEFEDAALGFLLPTGPLAASAFSLNVASGGSAQFVYKTATDTLYWDADGNGAGTAIAIAQFFENPTLSAADIVII